LNDSAITPDLNVEPAASEVLFPLFIICGPCYIQLYPQAHVLFCYHHIHTPTQTMLSISTHRSRISEFAEQKTVNSMKNSENYN